MSINYLNYGKSYDLDTFPNIDTIINNTLSQVEIILKQKGLTNDIGARYRWTQGIFAEELFKAILRENNLFYLEDDFLYLSNKNMDMFDLMNGNGKTFDIKTSNIANESYFNISADTALYRHVDYYICCKLISDEVINNRYKWSSLHDFKTFQVLGFVAGSDLRNSPSKFPRHDNIPQLTVAIDNKTKTGKAKLRNNIDNLLKLFRYETSVPVSLIDNKSNITLKVVDNTHILNEWSSKEQGSIDFAIINDDTINDSYLMIANNFIKPHILLNNIRILLLKNKGKILDIYLDKEYIKDSDYDLIYQKTISWPIILNIIDEFEDV